MIELVTETTQSPYKHKWRLYWFHETDPDASYPADEKTLVDALSANPQLRASVLEGVGVNEGPAARGYSALKAKLLAAESELAAERARVQEEDARAEEWKDIADQRLRDLTTERARVVAAEAMVEAFQALKRAWYDNNIGQAEFLEFCEDFDWNEPPALPCPLFDRDSGPAEPKQPDQGEPGWELCLMQHLEDLLYPPEGHYELGEARPPKRTWKQHADRVEATLAERNDLRRRLGEAREGLEREERDHLKTLGRRDELEDIADELANAIGGDAIGEHSSDNDPWKNALEMCGEHSLVSELAELRAQLEAAQASAVDPGELEHLREAARLLNERVTCGNSFTESEERWVRADQKPATWFPHLGQSVRFKGIAQTYTVRGTDENDMTALVMCDDGNQPIPGWVRIADLEPAAAQPPPAQEPVLSSASRPWHDYVLDCIRKVVAEPHDAATAALLDAVCCIRVEMMRLDEECSLKQLYAPQYQQRRGAYGGETQRNDGNEAPCRGEPSKRP